MRSSARLFRKYLPGLLLLGAVIALTTFTVHRLRLPGQSNLLESLAMDMQAMKPEVGVVPVGTAKVSLRRVQPELRYSGTVRGFNEISIAARVAGTLSAVPVYAGTRVRQGQLLATLSAPELGAETGTAQAFARETQAELKVLEQEAKLLRAEEQTAQASLGVAQSELKAAEASLAYWQQRLPRERKLYEAGGIALEEYQRYQADAQMAESASQAARQRVRAAESELRARQARQGENQARQQAQQATLARAGSSLRERQVQQAFTQVTAPVSGVITERLMAPGSVVAAGTPLLTLAQINPVRVQVQVPEADLAGLEVGDLMILIPAAQSNQPIEASISSIAPASGTGTRTQQVEAIVPNPKSLLLPGQYVRASLRSASASQPQAAIPERALLQLEGADHVWLVRKGRAHLTPVKVAALSREWALVPELEKGAEVITDGYESLSEGMAVAPVHWTENGPQQLPEARGSNRLNAQNGWAIQVDLGQELLLKVAISPKPPTSNKNTLSFELLHGGQHPITDARIRLSTSMPAMNMEGPDLAAVSEGKGRYNASFSGMSGLWQVAASVESGGKRLQPVHFEFNLP